MTRLISVISGFVQEHLFFVWFVVIPLVSTLLCLKMPKRFFWMPPIAITASLLLALYVNPFLLQDLFGTPADDFSFVSAYWLMIEVFLFIPFTLAWMLVCQWLDNKRQTGNR